MASAKGLVSTATGVSIAVVAAIAAFAGFELVRFEIDATRVEALAAVRPQGNGSAASIARQKTNAVAAMSAWTHTPGVQGRARRLIATPTGGDAASVPGPAEFASVLAVEPTAAIVWLAYAERQLQAGVGPSEFGRAFEMSILTGRREARVMFARALFVLNSWELMETEKRAAAMAQLADLQPLLDEPERETLVAIVDGKPPATRQEIADELARKLGDRPGFLHSIGR